ncbi:MAG TPA: hypothetical protein VMJ32_18060 [Pirellulales bacterium]|nr:hypothetical protein [Pirellulales bacterium]
MSARNENDADRKENREKAEWQSQVMDLCYMTQRDWNAKRLRYVLAKKRQHKNKRGPA